MGTAWNASDAQGSGFTLSNGNKTVNFPSTSGSKGVRADKFRNTGKYYFELSTTGGASLDATTPGLGAQSQANVVQQSFSTGEFGLYGNGNKDVNSASVAYGSSIINSTVMFAVDFGAGKWWAGINGTWTAGGNPATGANPANTAAIGNVAPVALMSSAFSGACTGRWSTADFLYTPPAGFMPWDYEPPPSGLPQLEMPGDLPLYKASQHQIKTESMYGQVERQTGTSRRRRLFRSVPRIVETAIELTQAQLEAFYAWHEGPLKAGEAPFTAKIANMGVGIQYWRAHVLEWTADTEDGSMRTITLKLKLSGEPSATPPVPLSLTAEYGAALAAVFAELPFEVLSSEYAAIAQIVFASGEALSLEIFVGLEAIMGGYPPGGPTLITEINVPFEMFTSTEASSGFTTEFLVELDFTILTNPLLTFEAVMLLDFIPSGNPVGYVATPADISVFAYR